MIFYIDTEEKYFQSPQLAIVDLINVFYTIMTLLILQFGSGPIFQIKHNINVMVSVLQITLKFTASKRSVFCPKLGQRKQQNLKYSSYKNQQKNIFILLSVRKRLEVTTITLLDNNGHIARQLSK